MSRWPTLLVFAAVAAAQTEPAFRTGARVVTVDVLVRNNRGAVRGLTKEDFTLQDKGKTQSIAVFAVTEPGSTPASPQALPPGVVSNRVNHGGEQVRTATVILFDRLNIPTAPDRAVVRGRILALLASLQPADRLGFYSLGRDLIMVQDFNEDAGPMIEAAKRLKEGPAPEKGGPMDARLQAALTPLQPLDMTVRTATTAQSFQTVARHLAGIQGRKNLIWVASDFALTYGEAADRRTNYVDEVSKAANTLSESNIAVFPMDPRGVEGNQSNSSLGKDNADIPANTEGGLLRGKVALTPAAPAAGRKVMEEAEVSYTLGFYVDEKALDGKRHDLHVKLAKKPETSGATVRHRKSYLALSQRSNLAEAQRPAMAELVDDAFDATAIGLMAAAAPDPSKPGVHVVQVRVDLSTVPFEHRADKWAAAFDLGMALETGAGQRPLVNIKPLSLNLTDDQLKKGLAAGLIVDNTVPSPDKPAQLRVVVQDKSSGAAGSVRIPLSPR